MDGERFFGIDGDVSTQLAPWILKRRGLPLATPIFRLEKSFRFHSDIAGGVILVEDGFESDLASIPQFAWSIFMKPDDPRIELGAWVHDVIYRTCGDITLENGHHVKLSRKQADQILCFEAMKDLLATPFQIHAVYQSLRRLGIAWKGDGFLERFS